MRKLVSVLLAFMMVICCVPTQARADDPPRMLEDDTIHFNSNEGGEAITIADGCCGDYIYWTLDDRGTLQIAGMGPMWDYNGWSPWIDYEIVRVVIEEGVTAVGECAFLMCTELNSVSLPNSVTSIGSNAFNLCENLENIILPENVAVIGAAAFSGCGLTNIYIPESVTTIGEAAFGLCDSLAGFAVDSDNPSYSSDSMGVLFDKNMTTLIEAPGAIQGIYEIPEGVEFIGDRAFLCCYGLTGVTIPDSVNVIGSSAFEDCDNLESIIIPAGVSDIGQGAFRSCGNMIGIYVNEENPYYSSDSAGVLFNKNKDVLYGAPGAITEYTIPATVINIGDYAFSSCADLIDITIPDGVSEIGSGAFWACSALQDITIPDSVSVIGERAFENCRGLTSVTIPESVVYIGSYAFTQCWNLARVTINCDIGPGGYIFSQPVSALTEVVIGENVTLIGIGAFYGNGSLSTVCYNGTPEEWVLVYIDDMNSDLLNAGIHFNEDGDHLCDTCGRAFTNCIDDNHDHICDICGETAGTHEAEVGSHDCAYCGEAVTECADGDTDHDCDTCGEAMGEHKAAEGSHDCAYCGKTVTDCYDNDTNHKCDVCGETLSECKDENGDYKCDICGAELEEPTEPAEEEINREAGSNRFDTANKVADQMKEAMGVEQFDAVILANGYNFADALAGSYLSSQKQAPILLTWNGAEKYNYLNDATIEYVKANLKPGGTVYILGGTSAVPASIDAALSEFVIKRMDGANRFETNLMILEEAGIADGTEVLVCTATNFADSLSASAAGKPILLVFNEYGKLYGDQPKFLEGLKNCTFTIIGGESAVSQKLVDAIGTYGQVTRLAGKNRFETSVLVAEKYFPEATSAVLAYAWDFPDGLCGGGLAYAMQAPLILTMTKYEAQAADYIQSQGIKSGVVLGGDTLISDDAVRAIFAMDADDENVVK